MLRWILTIAGIVLGVAVFVAMHTANRSVFSAFDKTVDEIAGATQLQITAGDFGFDESVLERVQSVPEVGVAVPVIEAVVETRLPGQGSIMVLGTDMTSDRSLRDYEYWAQTRDRSSWMMCSCSKRRGEIGPCRLQRRCKPCEHTRNNANGERDDGSAQLQAVVEQRHPR